MSMQYWLAIDRRILAGLLVLMVLLGWADRARAGSPTYNLVTLGLNTAEHVGTNGMMHSTVYQINSLGYVIGNSYRYTGTADMGQSAWLYNGSTTLKLGLTTSEWTRSNGYKFSSPTMITPDGKVAGISYRYNGGSTSTGQSAWYWTGSAMYIISLTAPEWTRSDGYRFSNVLCSSAAGMPVGYSNRYSGMADMGRTAWVVSNTTPVNIGLTGTEWTSSSGYRYSNPTQFNQSGLIAGIAYRYSGASDMGQSVWLYNGTTTLNIGLTGAEWTRNDGYKVSYVDEVCAGGQVRGTSRRFSGAADVGQSAWIYNGTTTQDVGLTGAEWISTNGYKSAYATVINQTGQAAGWSSRYVGGVDMGQSAWFYNGTTTRDISLTGATFTSSDGLRISTAVGISQAGKVMGYANRYSGTTDTGQSAWYFNGTATTDISPMGSEWTRLDGYKDVTPTAMNNSGLVIGTAKRYNATLDIGQSAWFSDGTTTRIIGLTGPQFTYTYGNAGYGTKCSEVSTMINSAGLVAGSSDRFNGRLGMGTSAWVYDSTLDQTYEMLLSVSEDGRAYSRITELYDNGIAIGYYTLYNGLETVGNRAFIWTRRYGARDLGVAVTGGVISGGWDALCYAYDISAGKIMGEGALNDQASSEMGYLLKTVLPGDANGDGLVNFTDYLTLEQHFGVVSGMTQADGDFDGNGAVNFSDYLILEQNFGGTMGVPEPATVTLLALGGLAILRRRRDR